MTDRYRSVPVKQEFGDGKADDLAASDHHGVPAGDLIVSVLKESYDAHRSTRNDAGRVRPLLP